MEPTPSSTEISGAPVLAQTLAIASHSTITEVAEVFAKDPAMTVVDFILKFTDLK
jgi:hypothetical protein